MLITNSNVYTKPYMVMYVGNSKFIIQPKVSVIVMVSDIVCTIYKNNKLLGQIIDDNLHTDADTLCDVCDTDWDCGWPNLHGHKIPFYYSDNIVSIFGFKVTQYICDRIQLSDLSTRVLRDNLLQI